MYQQPQIAFSVQSRSSMNSWDDQNVRDSLATNGHKKIVVAGLWLEVCNLTFALGAMLEGLRNLHGECASGATSNDAHRQVVLRQKLSMRHHHPTGRMS